MVTKYNQNISIDGDSYISARITDLGHCKKFYESDEVLSDNYGSRIYRNIKHDLRTGRQHRLHTCLCDVYSLGIISYVILARDMPYQIDKEKKSTGEVVKTFGGEKKTHVIEIDETQNSQEINTQEVYEEMALNSGSQSSLHTVGYHHEAHRIGSLKDPHEIYFLCFNSKWNHLSTDVVELIRRTVVIDDEKRASIQEVLDLNYFKKSSERYNVEDDGETQNNLDHYISKVNKSIRKSENKKKSCLLSSLPLHDDFETNNAIMFENGKIICNKTGEDSGINENLRCRSSAFSELAASQDLSQRSRSKMSLPKSCEKRSIENVDTSVEEDLSAATSNNDTVIGIESKLIYEISGYLQKARINFGLL